MNSPEPALIKRKTGLPGLDEITGGGLPAAGATLIIGQAGAGKSVFCLQILAKTITTGTGAIYVSFEESRAQIHRDAASFSWGKTLIAADNWDVIDAPGRHTMQRRQVALIWTGCWLSSAAGQVKPAPAGLYSMVLIVCCECNLTPTPPLPRLWPSTTGVNSSNCHCC